MDHGNYSKLLRQAADSDTLVEQLLNAKRNVIHVQLVDNASSRANLDARMPQMSPQVAAVVTPVRNALVKLLKELNVLLKNRKNAIAALQRATSADDITTELVASGCGVPQEALEAEGKGAVEGKSGGPAMERWSRDKERRIFQAAARKHEAKKNAVYANMEKQSGLFQQISEHNMHFALVKEDSAATRQREQVVNAINAAVLDFHDVHSKIKQGSSFYGDLRLRCDQLRQTVSGHVHGRALQVSGVLT